jgi:hypothetical protein
MPPLSRQAIFPVTIVILLELANLLLDAALMFSHRVSGCS